MILQSRMTEKNAIIFDDLGLGFEEDFFEQIVEGWGYQHVFFPRRVC